MKKKDNTTILKKEGQGERFFKIVGERFKELRLLEELAQKDLENKLGLRTNSVGRMESGKGGTIISFLSFLNFYLNKGYNLYWILKFDNSNEFKKETQQLTMRHDARKILEILKNLKKNVNDLQDEIEGIE